MKMKNRIFLSIFTGSLIALILSLVCITGVMYNAMTEELRVQIRNEAKIVSSAANSFTDNDAFTKYISAAGTGSGNRITLVAADGTVLYDNFSKVSEMGNHLDRPEIAEALQNGTGKALRASDTLGEHTYYYAVRLADGSILRIANTTKSVLGIVGHPEVIHKDNLVLVS